MVDYKIVKGHNKPQTDQKEVKDPESQALFGKRIGAEVKGDDIGFPGYEFKITGGSDKSGFPMRWDIDGAGKRRVFSVEGIGVHKKAKGLRRRKTVAGGTVGEQTVQVNLKVLKEGKEPLIAPPAEEAKEGEGAEASKTEEKPSPESQKKEEPKEVPKDASKEKEAAPKEESKEEPSKEKQEEDVKDAPKDA